MGQVTVTDMVDQARLTATTNSIKATRKFLVESLTDTATRRLWEAATAAGIPKVSDRHPGIPFLYCSNLDVQPAEKDPNQAYVLAEYETLRWDGSNQPPSTSGQCSIEVGATVSTFETSKDKDGNDIVLNPNGTGTITRTTGGTPVVLGAQPVKISVNKSHPYLTLSRPEPLPFNTTLVRTYVNGVNSVPWFGGAARTWYCAAIRSTITGDHCQVNYEFQYDPDTWDIPIQYTDPDTNAPIVLSQTSDSTLFYKTIRKYAEADFNGLNLGV